VAVIDDAIRAGLTAVRCRVERLGCGCPLITDPCAPLLLSASAARGLHPGPVPYAAAARIAVRTRWFDDYLTTAAAHGLTRVVLVGAGLDTRPWRLPWLADSVVYEVERPAVTAFKLRVLGAPPVDHRPVDADGWPQRLRDTGFDHSVPTVWVFEQPPATVPDAVFALSARGSRLAAVSADGAGLTAALTGHGWTVAGESTVDVLHRNHLPAGPDGTATLALIDARYGER